MRFDGKTLACTKAELKALLEHASDDGARSHVASICFDLEKNCAVATDGHRLARCAFDPTGKPIPKAIIPKAIIPKSGAVLVPRDVIAKAMRILGQLGARINFETSRIVDAEDGGAEFPFTPVDAKFPPYESVIPDFNERRAGVSQCLHAKFLTAIGLVVDAATETGTVQVYPPPCSLDPFVAQVLGESTWTIVIMPKKFGDGEIALKDCDNVTPRKLKHAPQTKHPKSWLGAEGAKAS